MANNWFKRIAARLRKSAKPTEVKTEENRIGEKVIEKVEIVEQSDKRYHLSIVDNVTGERIVNEHTDAVFGVFLGDRSPEYIVNMSTCITNVTSMVMKAEALCEHVRGFESRIGECESDILQRAKENKGKMFL